MPDLGTRGKAIATWAAREELDALLTDIAIGIGSGRTVTAVRPVRKLCNDHIFALISKLNKHKKHPGGIRSRGVLLVRWVMYFVGECASDLSNLPTVADGTIKAFLERWEARALVHSKAIGKCRARAESAETGKLESMLLSMHKTTGKSAEAQHAAYRAAMTAIADAWNERSRARSLRASVRVEVSAFGRAVLEASGSLVK